MPSESFFFTNCSNIGERFLEGAIEGSPLNIPAYNKRKESSHFGENFMKPNFY